MTNHYDIPTTVDPIKFDKFITEFRLKVRDLEKISVLTSSQKEFLIQVTRPMICGFTWCRTENDVGINIEEDEAHLISEGFISEEMSEEERSEMAGFFYENLKQVLK